VPRSVTPDAVKSEVGLLGDHVVIGVVVKDAESAPVGKGGDQQMHGRELVMSDACEPRLGVEGTLRSDDKREGMKKP